MKLYRVTCLEVTANRGRCRRGGPIRRLSLVTWYRYNGVYINTSIPVIMRGKYHVTVSLGSDWRGRERTCTRAVQGRRKVSVKRGPSAGLELFDRDIMVVYLVADRALPGRCRHLVGVLTVL